MINEIKCLNPRFILNPSLLLLLSVHRSYVLGDGSVRHVTDDKLTAWRLYGLDLFRSFLMQLTLENVNNFGVVDKDTGELLPMFLYVPCGKCVCCRTKKAMDWKTRCCCESATSSCSPLFFTLTYDPLHLPNDGLNKKDIQNWLKRLRSMLSYRGFDVSNLRYFIVGEYGSNTHRAHYHGLFWNFPYMDRMIDKIDIIHDTWQNGFTMVSPARDLSGSYCMKYMQKEPVKVDGKNDSFFLSSRKNGGLGAQWIRDNFDYYRSHPQLTQIQVKSFDGEIYILPMPVYFTRKLFPSLCGLIPLNVRKSLDSFLINYQQLSVVNDYARKVGIKPVLRFTSLDLVRECFAEFGLTDSDYDLPQVFNYFSFLQKDLMNHINDTVYINSLQNYYSGLMDYDFDNMKDFIFSDKQYIRDSLRLYHDHKNFVSCACEHLNHIEIEDYVFKIQNFISKDLQKEIF